MEAMNSYPMTGDFEKHGSINERFATVLTPKVSLWPSWPRSLIVAGGSRFAIRGA